MNPKTGEQLSRYVSILRRVLPIVAFAIPLFILYTLDPGSFELTWKGRTFYLFFIWLIILETILSWRKPKPILGRFKSLKIAALGIALALPTVYVIAANYGINDAIAPFAEKIVSGGAPNVTLSIEYLVLTVLSIVVLAATYGVYGLQDFPIAPLFLGMIGLIYMVDSLYPYGKFTPFQIVVPTTTQLAASVLNMLGFTTRIGYVANNPTYGSMSSLLVIDSAGNRASALVAWGCSGIESLIIYTITIVLFLRRTPIATWLKLVYFSIGAVVTYFINALRIATLFIISVNNVHNGGIVSPAANDFHYFYGQLYSITWIMLYPLLLIGIQLLSSRIRTSEPLTLTNQTSMQQTDA
ncbi:MAG TPA: exosortase/archaeosortase family protein [Candidatus Acidoferrum sp.]|nr:exosortase/archaeosortase family protein [Candidatus Acidoferrum sp.]